MFYSKDLVYEMDGLRKFALKLTGNSSDAEDLLQSTVLRAIEKKHLFQEGTNLFKWTSKIMFNLFVSGYRRKAKFESQYDPETYIEKQKVEPDQESKMQLQQVEAAMNTISDDHRQILDKVCIKGKRYAEVSEELGIPVGTVRSRLSRARSALQEALDTPGIQKVLPPYMQQHQQAEFAKIAA